MTESEQFFYDLGMSDKDSNLTRTSYELVTLMRERVWGYEVMVNVQAYEQGQRDWA